MRKGFSLIEMSVVLLIISIVVAGGLTIGQSVSLREDYGETEETMDKLVEKLAEFYGDNNRLPCPAATDLKLGDSDFGLELYSKTSDTCVSETSAVSGMTRVQIGSTGRYVRIGSVPTRSLKVSDRLMIDKFNNRITYAVHEDMTDDSTSAGVVDELTVDDGRGNDITDVIYVLVSHGKDGKGATSFKGVAAGDGCSGSDLDVENCDGDTTFTDTRFNNEEGSSTFFDDVVLWITKARL